MDFFRFDRIVQRFAPRRLSCRADLTAGGGVTAAFATVGMRVGSAAQDVIPAGGRGDGPMFARMLVASAPLSDGLRSG